MPQHKEASFMMFAWEYANMASLLHVKLKNLMVLPSSSYLMHTTKNPERRIKQAMKCENQAEQAMRQ